MAFFAHAHPALPNVRSSVPGHAPGCARLRPAAPPMGYDSRPSLPTTNHQPPLTMVRCQLPALLPTSTSGIPLCHRRNGSGCHCALCNSSSSWCSQHLRSVRTSAYRRFHQYQLLLSGVLPVLSAAAVTTTAPFCQRSSTPADHGATVHCDYPYSKLPPFDLCGLSRNWCRPVGSECCRLIAGVRGHAFLLAAATAC
jgi:hypothetical protein